MPLLMTRDTRSALVTLSLASVVAAVTFLMVRGSEGDPSDTAFALSSPTVRAETGEQAAGAVATLMAPRTPVAERAQNSAAAVEEELPPTPRRLAETWMAARNSAHVQTVDQRLNELNVYRKQFSEMKGDSFLRYQQMVAVASVAVATHLDELGQATTSALQATERQWSTGVGGANYVFERGRYPAYDAAMEAFEAALKESTAARDTLGFAAAAPPIPAEITERLEAFVDSAVLLLTRTE
jgi:hypothetical protein